MSTVTGITPMFARESESCSARAPTPSTTPRTYAKQQTAGFRIWASIFGAGALESRNYFAEMGSDWLWGKVSTYLQRGK